MQPRGATELQMEMLEKHVSKDLLDQVQICTSIPGKVPIDSNKLNILWQQTFTHFLTLISKYFNRIFSLTLREQVHLRWFQFYIHVTITYTKMSILRRCSD
mgnify:CR=1 FL=1